jgi:hypothetical protein
MQQGGAHDLAQASMLKFQMKYSKEPAPKSVRENRLGRGLGGDWQACASVFLPCCSSDRPSWPSPEVSRFVLTAPRQSVLGKPHVGPRLPVFGSLTPFPATPLYERLQKAGRLTRPKHWQEFLPFAMAHTWRCLASSNVPQCPAETFETGWSRGLAVSNNGSAV